MAILMSQFRHSGKQLVLGVAHVNDGYFIALED
jgi:hypothetical protein